MLFFFARTNQPTRGFSSFPPFFYLLFPTEIKMLSPSNEIYHRAYPSVRSVPSASNISAPSPSPRLAPLLPPAALENLSINSSGLLLNQSPVDVSPEVRLPTKEVTLCGLPLKYVSLVTLAVQNASLSIVMHYSRISTPPHLSYSPASAVLLGEIIKGTISFFIALWRVKDPDLPSSSRRSLFTFLYSLLPWSPSFRQLCSEIFSADCWKLSIPALLYVVQNSLQFVAISNLPVASFQVAYQMKILTTAAFSVALLRRKLSSTKWLSLFFLAIGVGIVQVQTSSSNTGPREIRVGSAHDAAPLHIHIMSPLKGFGAVTAACFTSGLAGVYFEMVLKNSKADLWVRNVQLSLFSLIPAIVPILYAHQFPTSDGLISYIFRNFGGWAWATVATQVFGGLVTAVVIKYSDNILKGFATSVSIILSFLASVVLFDFHVTLPFIIGASTVLAATAMYNQPAAKEAHIATSSGSKTPFSELSLGKKDPILGEFPLKKPSPFGSPRAIASALGLGERSVSEKDYFSETESTSRYLNAPYGSPFPSRTTTPRPEERP